MISSKKVARASRTCFKNSTGSRAGRPCHDGGFTLLELILMMLIMAIAAAIVVPSLGRFIGGRSSTDSATQIMALARYARTQAIADGATYRLQLDAAHGTYQLTVQKGGVFLPVQGQSDFGKTYTLPPGVKMSVNISPQPDTQLIPPTDQTQTNAIPSQPIGQPIAQANTLVLNQHQGGDYVEFDPDGRTDPVYIQLTDKNGNSINLGCASSTEELHILSPGEMQS